MSPHTKHKIKREARIFARLFRQELSLFWRDFLTQFKPTRNHPRYVRSTRRPNHR